MTKTTCACLIRAATRDDLPTLVRFNRLLALETEDLALDEERLTRGVRAMFDSSDRGRYRIAEVSGEVAGQLMLTLEWSDWRAGWWWWIQSVYVDKRHRRMGVFRALYESVLEDAAKDGSVHGVRLYVEDQNHGAQATYASLGMKQAKYRIYANTDE